MPSIASEISTETIRIYLPSFPFNLRFENLRDSKGILLTMKMDRPIVNKIRNAGELVSELKISDCE